MNFLYFLADNLFRFKYRDPYSTHENRTFWALDVFEEENEKMRRDFFIMGLVFGVVISLLLVGALWLIAL
jgi:hypothetical protein